VKMSDDQDKVLEWAVETLREAQNPALPDGFLARFEERLEAEEETLDEPQVTRRLAPAAISVMSQPRSRWYHSLAVAIAMIAILGFLLTNPPSLPKTGSGIMVVAATNQVQVQQVAVNRVQELAVGQTLDTGTTGEVVLLAKSLGNEIRVAPETRLKLTQVSKSTQVAEMSLDRGSVLIRETRSRIAVRTEHVVVTPIGTEYEVRRTENGTEVVVFDGEVRVSKPGGSSGLLLKKEQSISVSEQTDWSQVKPRRFSEDESVRPKLYGSSIELDHTPRRGEELRPYPVAKKPVKDVKPPANATPVRPRVGATPRRPIVRSTPKRPPTNPRPARPRAGATPVGPHARPSPGHRVGVTRPGKVNPGPNKPRTSVGQPYPTAQPRRPGNNGQGPRGQTGPGAVRQPGVNGPRPGQGPGMHQPGQRPRPGVNQPGQGPRPGMNQPGQGPRPGMNRPGQGPRPGMNQPGQGPRPGVNQPGQGPRSGVNQPGQGPRPGMRQPGQGPRPGMRQPGQGPRRGVNQSGQGPRGMNRSQQGQGQGMNGGQSPRGAQGAAGGNVRAPASGRR
jgi:ferric-dicitrate binding protein FerR (iron transport regulator)